MTMNSDKAADKKTTGERQAGQSAMGQISGQKMAGQSTVGQTVSQNVSGETAVRQAAASHQMASRAAGQSRQAPCQASAQSGNGEKKIRSKRKIWIFLLVIIAFLGGAFAWQAYRPQNRMEPNAVVGAMPGKTDEQIQEELNRKVEEKMIAFSINSHPVYPDGRTAGNILFENPSSNNKLTKMELYLDDTGEKIYETGLLRPGSYVPDAKLDTSLAAGDYVCTAYIYAYRLEDESYIGKVAAGITITVQK